MPTPFTITVPSDSIRLDGGKGQTTFTVANNTGRQTRGRGQILPQKPEAASWISVAGEAERTFAPGAVEQYTVVVQTPPGTAEGDHTFRLRVADPADPNELYTDGPMVAFKVAGLPPPPPPTKKFPWILIVIGVAFVVILGGIVTWLLLRDKGVPDVVGKTAREATAILAKKDLKARIRGQSGADATVESQDPEAGGKTPANKIVDLMMSGDAGGLKLDNYRGQDARRVVLLLDRMGLRNIVIVTRPGTEPAFRVVDQDPEEGTRPVANTRITLTVREDPVAVPSVTRRPLAIAVTMLRDAGFQCCWITRDSGGSFEFEVLKQDPDPSMGLTSRAKMVRLVVKEGPAFSDILKKHRVSER